MYAYKMRKTSNSRNLLFFITTATAETQISTQFYSDETKVCELKTLYISAAFITNNKSRVYKFTT